MDWIGRTETLSQETLPMLTTMMFGNADRGRKIQKSNASPQTQGFVQLANIASQTRRALEQLSQLDVELYNLTLQNYKIEQWSNF